MKRLITLLALNSFVLVAFGQGKAVDFDGTNDYIDFSNVLIPASAASDPWTLEMWIKTTTTGVDVMFSQYASGNNDRSQFHVNFVTSGKAGYWKNSSGGQIVTSSTSVNDGNWHHIAWVKEGSGANQVHLYVNGILEDSGMDGNAMSNISSEIGRINSGVDPRYYPGSLDEVRIWDDARTAAEIRTNMHKKLTGSESNLIAYYSFDNVTTCNGTAGEIEDETANTNDGTCVNMDNGDAVTSTAPIGPSGTVNSVTAHQNGSAAIGDITFDDTPDMFDNSQDVYVSTISNAPNVTTGITESNVPNEYRVINIFENGGIAGTFSVTLTLPSPTTDGNNVTLYSRNTGSIGTWSSEGSATASGGNVTFTGITGFSQFIMATNSVLSVEWVDFSVRKLGSSSELNWQTASETNNEGFEIEWSTDERSWQNIGFVNGEGTTIEKQTYFFLHKNPAHGVNYYRLKQMDYDGVFEYSDIVSVDLTNFQNLSNLRITPNPVQNGEVTLYLPDTDFEEATLEIFNSVGKLIRTEILNSNQTNIRTSDLSKELYLFSVRINGQATTERVVIR